MPTYAGSNPVGSTIYVDVAQLVEHCVANAKVFCGFETHHPLQYAALVDHLAQLPSKQQNRGKHSDAAPSSDSTSL